MPEVVDDAVFTAVVEASATEVFTAVVEASVFDGAGTVANVVARPATLVVVVGVVAESPGLAPLAILSDAIFWSPVVLRDVADGVNFVVDPAGEFPPS